MNQELNQLQILNDLIAQTLDIIAQRNLSTQRTFGVGGLSHTPHTPYGHAGIDPRVGAGALPTGNLPMGLTHTPYDPRINIDPRFGYTDPRFATQTPTYWGVTGGLSHTPYNAPFGLNGETCVPYSVSPQFSRPMPPNWGMPMGFSHTPYDPRISMGFGWNVPADPRLAQTASGVPYRW